MIHDSVDDAKKGSACPSQSNPDMAQRQRQEEELIKQSLDRI